MLRRVDAEARWPTLLFLAVAADASITFVGITEIGPGIEGNAVARMFFDQVNWLSFGLGRAAGLYFLGYLAAGVAAAMALYWGREHIDAAPLGRFFAPSLTAVFAASALANVWALSLWISHIPDATWF